MSTMKCMPQPGSLSRIRDKALRKILSRNLDNVNPIPLRVIKVNLI